MWRPATRIEHSRSHLRYASDLTDAEWALLEPSLPRPANQGRNRKWPIREVVNAILYVLRSGCPWRLLPEPSGPRSDGFPPVGTVWHWFRRLRDAGTFARLGHRLTIMDRDGAGLLIRASRHQFPFVECVYADRGYQWQRVREGSPIPVHIVRPLAGQVGFAVRPRRWVVERTFAWLGRNRRLWKNAETTVASSTAFVQAAAANVLLCRIARA